MASPLWLIAVMMQICKRIGKTSGHMNASIAYHWLNERMNVKAGACRVHHVAANLEEW